MLRPALLLLLLAAPAHAEEMTFYLDNRAPYSVAAELSAAGSGGLWPGGGKVYFLDKGERKSVRIECRGGEPVCYGAWRFGDDSRAWGVGPDRNLTCEDCCFTCVTGSAGTIAIGE